MDLESAFAEFLKDEELANDPELKDVRSLNPRTLIKNEEDAEMLGRLSELEREAIIAERRFKLEKIFERLEVRRLIKRRAESFIPQHKSHEEKHNWDGHREHYRDSGYNAHKSEHQVVSLNQALSLQVTRREIESWISMPLFEKVIKGCLLRVCVEINTRGMQVYSVMQVLGVCDAQNYPLGAKNISKCALVKVNGSQRVQSFDMVSNSPISQAEYNSWLKKNDLAHDFVKLKIKEIKKAKESCVKTSQKVSANIPSQILQLRNLYNQTSEHAKKEEITKKIEELKAVFKKKTASLKSPKEFREKLKPLADIFKAPKPFGVAEQKTENVVFPSVSMCKLLAEKVDLSQIDISVVINAEQNT